MVHVSILANVVILKVLKDKMVILPSGPCHTTDNNNNSLCVRENYIFKLHCSV